MAAKKKAPAKKKKTTAKKPVAQRRMPAIRSKMTKSEILGSISESTGLTKKQVASVMDEMNELIGRSIKKNGVGEFTVPGAFKVVAQKKPARKARKGVNPFTGEEMMFKAKPASVAVKIRPLKKLKEFANG